MSRDKSVVFAFPPGLGNPEMPPSMAKPVESVPAPGKDLVRIALVPHVPDEFIAAGVANTLCSATVSSTGTEVGGKMPSGFGDGVRSKTRGSPRTAACSCPQIQPFDVGRGNGSCLKGACRSRPFYQSSYCLQGDGDDAQRSKFPITRRKAPQTGVCPTFSFSLLPFCARQGRFVLVFAHPVGSASG